MRHFKNKNMYNVATFDKNLQKQKCIEYGGAFHQPSYHHQEMIKITNVVIKCENLNYFQITAYENKERI